MVGLVALLNLTYPITHGRIFFRCLHTGPIIPAGFLEEKLDTREAILSDDDGLHYWKKLVV